MRTYLLLFSFVTCVHGRFIQSHHSGLTQRAQVACWTSASENHFRFFLVKNSDRIDAVYTVADDNITDTSIERFDSFGTGIQGNGTADNPFTFEVTTSASPPQLDPDVQADTKATTEGDDSIRVYVMAKSIFVEPFYQKVIFAEDVVYNAFCNFSDAQGDVVVTTQSVDVEGSIREEPIIINNKAVMEVLDANGTVTTRVKISESVQLSVRPLQTNVSGITGVYVKNCFVCNNAQCSGGVQAQFIGPEGCSIGNYIRPFTSPGFGASTTDPFPMFQFNGEVRAYFKCDVGFCSDPAEDTCKDFCKSSEALLGRRKRQAESEEVVLYSAITVEDGEEPPNTGGDAENLAAAFGSDKTEEMNLVAAVCTVAGVLCLMLILAGVIYYRITLRKSRGHR